MSAKVYRILLDEGLPGKKSGTAYITEDAAKIIWSAYEHLWPLSRQTMDIRESRGGICWLSELNEWKQKGLIPESFNYKDHCPTFTKDESNE